MLHLDGRIASVGFASGDRFVVGDWRATPIGPMNDVMWATPSGERVLLVPDSVVGEFVTSVYHFDRVMEVPFRVDRAPRSLTVEAGPLRLVFEARHGVRLPFVRPCWFTRAVEEPLARTLLDVHTYGVSPTGAREWYRATGFRLVRDARAHVDGLDLGAWGAPRPALRVGFGEAPRWASFVELRTSLTGGAVAPWVNAP